MLGIGNADLERFLVLAVVLTILALLVRVVFVGPRQVPAIPPTVSPMQHPLDGDVQMLRHRLDNVDQQLPDLRSRTIRHEEQIGAVRDLDEIKGALKRSEHMLNVLVEHGLKD